MRRSADPWRWPLDAPVAVAMAAAAVALAWTFRSVLVTSDPWHYAQAALNFGTHEWLASGLTRWGIIVPLLIPAAVFGATLPMFYAFALAATAVVVPVVYVLARWVGTTLTAVFTVVAFVATPLTFVNLSRGYPDLMAVALNGLTLILVLVARDRDRVGLLVLAGLVAGWAFEVRETTVFTWPLFAWIVFGLSRRWLGLLLVLLGLFPWAVADVILSWRTLGDPLAKWNVLTGSDLNDSVSPLDGAYLGHERLWYVTRLPVAISEQPWGWAVLLLAALGILGGLILRGRVGLYVVWALLPVGLLMLQAGVLDPAHPSVRVDVPRYWLAFTPGLTIAAVAFAGWLCERLRLPEWLGAAVLALVIGVAGWQFARAEPSLYPNSGRLPYATVQQIPDGAIVWTDGRSRRILPVYLTETGKQATFNDFTLKRANPTAGEYVLLFSHTDPTCEFCKLDYDLWRDSGNRLPVEDYQEVWTAPDGKARLYRVP